MTPADTIHPDIALLISKYVEVFSNSIRLPRQRLASDHQISLKVGTKPVNIKPYKYSLAQKDVIEELATKLLEQGIVRPNNSPFTTPMVLVKKKMVRGRCILL